MDPTSATPSLWGRDDDDVVYYNPTREIYSGLWTLFAGATLFLGLRLWCKLTRRHGLWYDDYVLISAYLVLLTTDILITVEYATGYANGHWDDRMHILINVSSIGTVIGQAVSKTAFGVTLLRMVEARWQAAVLWFCIISMDGIALSKCIFQWAKQCDKDDYQQWYRIQGWCLTSLFVSDWKEIGNIYNILMDFIFAIFPWFITWKLNLKRAEKIALCATLSMGISIAIVTAVRTWWKDTPLMHVHDRWYMWRDAVSETWYSSEVAGTIIVQCIPVLRPLLKDIHNTLTSRRLEATEPTRTGGTGKGQNTSWRGSTLVDKKGGVLSFPDSKGEDDVEMGGVVHSTKIFDGIMELREIPEERYEGGAGAGAGAGAGVGVGGRKGTTTVGGMQMGNEANAYFSPSELDLRIRSTHTKPLATTRQNWPL